MVLKSPGPARTISLVSFSAGERAVPLDILCPSCRSAFPVTNAGASFHVECPSCDAGIGVSVEHPDSHRIGSVPRASARLAAAPAGKALPPSAALAAADDDEDARKRGGNRSIGWVVFVGSGVGLVLVLAGLGVTGYFLFTNLDTDDPQPTARTAAAGPVRTATPNTPRPAPFTPTPSPFTPTPTPPLTTIPTPKIPAPKVTPKPKPKDATAIVWKDAPVTKVDIPAMPAGGQDTYTIAFPRGLDQVRVGGGGRYVVATFRSPRKMVVYDLCSGKTVAETALDTNVLSFAVGMNKLVMLQPNRRVLKVYTFPEMQPLGDVQLTGLQLPPDAVAMGSHTNNPVFVVGSTEVSLVDLELMGMVEGSAKTINGPGFGSRGEVRASHDGKLFGFASGNWMQTYKVENGKWVERRLSAGTLPLIGATTDLLYGDGQLYTPDGQPVGPRVSAPDRRVALVPATHGTQFVKITELLPPQPKQGPVVTVHNGREIGIPAVTLGEIPELGSPIPLLFGGDAAYLDRQVFFVPGAKVLAFIPRTKDKLILRRLKLD